jgi:uncharacterized protein
MKLRFAFGQMLILGLILLVRPHESRAQNPFNSGLGGGDGISVYGTGELTARPNMVEIDLNVSGKAELTGDALVKYRDAKKRIVEAIDKLKIKGVSTEELALTITAGASLEQQQRVFNNNGMVQAASKPQIEVSSVSRIKLKDIRDVAPEELLRTIGKLIDVSQDAGITIGPTAAEVMRNMRYGNYNLNNTAPVRFVVTDLSEIREKAYERAVADARRRATRLAKLNQVKLGAALSVQEIQVAGDQVAQNPNLPNVPQVGGDDKDEPRITSSTLSGVPVQVKLLIRFAIEAPEPATAQQVR